MLNSTIESGTITDQTWLQSNDTFVSNKTDKNDVDQASSGSGFGILFKYKSVRQHFRKFNTEKHQLIKINLIKTSFRQNHTILYSFNFI